MGREATAAIAFCHCCRTGPGGEATDVHSSPDVRCAQTCAARALVAAMQPNRRRSGGVPLTHELHVAALAGAAVNEEKLSQQDSGGEAWACIRLVLPCEKSFYSY